MKFETLEQMLTREVAEYKAEKSEAYHALMKLIPSEHSSEAIELFVKATFASFWEGWDTRSLSNINNK